MGKAGLGKVILMGLIYYSPHVRSRLLHKRAGNFGLETASFLGGRFRGAGSLSWVESTPPRLTHNLRLPSYNALSTLMRFIYCSPCTQQVLHKRAGNLELEMASFLGGRFWGAGSRSWVEAPQDSPLTSDYCYPSGGGYSAPGCRLLSSVQPYPQQVQQPLPQCLQPFKGPTSSFERFQLPSAQLLAWCPRRLKGAITFLKSKFSGVTRIGSG